MAVDDDIRFFIERITSLLALIASVTYLVEKTWENFFLTMVSLNAGVCLGSTLPLLVKNYLQHDAETRSYGLFPTSIWSEAAFGFLAERLAVLLQICCLFFDDSYLPVRFAYVAAICLYLMANVCYYSAFHLKCLDEIINEHIQKKTAMASEKRDTKIRAEKEGEKIGSTDLNRTSNDKTDEEEISKKGEEMLRQIRENKEAVFRNRMERQMEGILNKQEEMLRRLREYEEALFTNERKRKIEEKLRQHREKQEAAFKNGKE